MPSPCLRELSPEELPRCARLVSGLPLYQSYGVVAEGLQRQLEEGLADPRQQLLGVAVGGQLLGLAWVIQQGAFHRAPYLKLLAVAGEAQGRGLGSALMDRLEAEHLCPRGIFLLASLKNVGAQRFYARRGYRWLGELPGFAHPERTERIGYKPPPSAAAHSKLTPS